MYLYNKDEYLYIDTIGNFYRLRTKNTSSGTLNTYYRSYLLNDSEYKDEQGNTFPVLNTNVGLTRLSKTGEIYIQKQADTLGENKIYIKINPFKLDGSSEDKDNPIYYNLNNLEEPSLNKSQFKALGKNITKLNLFAPLKMHSYKVEAGKKSIS